jgi:hypothetical protein
MFVYGEYDDSPGGQLLGLVVVIIGVVGMMKKKRIMKIDKEIFRKKWYYRLLQVLSWGSLVPIAGGLIVFATLGVFEEDIPATGLFWAGVVIFVYWAVKRIFYYILFGESILPRKK